MQLLPAPRLGTPRLPHDAPTHTNETQSNHPGVKKQKQDHLDGCTPSLRQTTQSFASVWWWKKESMSLAFCSETLWEEGESCFSLEHQEEWRFRAANTGCSQEAGAWEMRTALHMQKKQKQLKNMFCIFHALQKQYFCFTTMELNRAIKSLATSSFAINITSCPENWLVIFVWMINWVYLFCQIMLADLVGVYTLWAG